MKKYYLLSCLLSFVSISAHAVARMCVRDSDALIFRVLLARSGGNTMFWLGGPNWAVTTASTWGYQWEFFDNGHVQLMGLGSCDTTAICACHVTYIRAWAPADIGIRAAFNRTTHSTAGVHWRGTIGNVACSTTNCHRFCVNMARSHRYTILARTGVPYVSVCGATSACPAGFSPVTAANHAGGAFAATVACNSAYGEFNVTCAR